MRFLTFHVGEREFAVNLDRVREIVAPPPITRVPGMPAALLGLVGLRGDPVAVVDAGLRLAGRRTVPGARTPLIVLTTVRDGLASQVALLVEGAGRQLDVDALLPWDAGLARIAGADACAGFADVEGRLVIVLDVDRLLAFERVAAAGALALAEAPTASTPAASPSGGGTVGLTSSSFAPRAADGRPPVPGGLPEMQAASPPPPPRASDRTSAGGGPAAGSGAPPERPASSLRTAGPEARPAYRAAPTPLAPPAATSDGASAAEGAFASAAAGRTNRPAPRLPLAPPPPRVDSSSPPARAPAGPGLTPRRAGRWAIPLGALAALGFLAIALTVGSGSGSAGRRPAPSASPQRGAGTAASSDETPPRPYASVPYEPSPPPAPETGAPAAAAPLPTRPRPPEPPALTPAPAVPAPRRPLPPALVVTPDTPPCEIHEVRKGDTLWHIAAKRLGDPYRWPQIFGENRDHLVDPDVIEVDDRIRIRGACTPARGE